MAFINAVRLKATLDGVEYTWRGGFGCVLASHERGVKLNEVRQIGHTLFYAHTVGRSGWLRDISWSPCQEVDVQWIRDFKSRLFSCS